MRIILIIPDKGKANGIVIYLPGVPCGNERVPLTTTPFPCLCVLQQHQQGGHSVPKDPRCAIRMFLLSQKCCFCIYKPPLEYISAGCVCVCVCLCALMRLSLMTFSALVLKSSSLGPASCTWKFNLESRQVKIICIARYHIQWAWAIQGRSSNSSWIRSSSLWRLGETPPKKKNKIK